MFCFLIPLIVSLTLVDNSYGQAYRNCDYVQRMVPNEQYYVYNREYPQNYPPGESCRWVLMGDRPIQISCDVFEIPTSTRCTQDALVIQEFENEPGYRNCGKGKFTMVSKTNNVTIVLKTASNSAGGRFLCTVRLLPTRVENSNCRCGWKNPKRIIGGEETGANEYPMMAALIDVPRKGMLCGATIINVKQVLTAAHCLVSANISALAVLVGDQNLMTGIDTKAAKLYEIDSTRIHREFNISTWDNDIAVLTIRGTIVFSQLVGPVCLPFEHSSHTFVGNPVEILGWGSTANAEKPSDTLRKAKVTVITNQRCSQTFPGITQRQICVYDKRKDSCQYDSGGPVLWENPSTRRLVQIGIISLGTSCGYGDPSQNTRVGAFISWIVSNTPPGVKNCRVE